MQPKSFSATALHVAELCLARYKAEHIDRAGRVGTSAASLGTAVHGALEMYVKQVYLDQKQEPSGQLLADLYRMSYMTTFGTADCDTEAFWDGAEMLDRWAKRTNWEGITVLSCEVKENFPIPTSLGEIPFNYIWDRFDRIGEREVKVVDYKTNRWAINPGDLKKKVQARAYGVAAAIKAKSLGFEVDKVWVEFDLLRHDPVGIVFSREENASCWRFLKEAAQRIIDTPDEETPETLNPECLFCLRKQTCKALTSNIASGGIFGLNLEMAVDRRAVLENQKKAITAALNELDGFIETECREKDLMEYETDLNKLSFTARVTRAVDGERVEQVVGHETFQKYGGLSITMGQYDKMMKDPAIPDEQKRQLKTLVYRNTGEIKVKTEPRSPIDDE